MNLNVKMLYTKYKDDEKTVREVIKKGRKADELQDRDIPYELIFEPNQKSDNILELNLKNGEIQDKGKFKSKCLEKSF